MRLAKYVLISAAALSFFGCSSGEKPRYEVVEIKGKSYLYDNEYHEKKLIDNGLAGSIDDFVDVIEGTAGAQEKFSESYKLKMVSSLLEKGYFDRIIALVPFDERQSFAEKEYKNLPLETQWQLAKISIKRKAEDGYATIKLELSNLIGDITSASETKVLGIPKDSIRQSYDSIHGYFFPEVQK